MNTMILYSSKYGCTTDCAKYLKSGLNGSVTLSDIDLTDPVPLEGYDTVIFGSSIYVGKISKKMKKYIRENESLFRQKRVGIFLCCGFPAQIKEYLTINFPPALLESAIAVNGFGGEARTDKMTFLDKAIMTAALKDNHASLQISHESMDGFIKKLNER